MADFFTPDQIAVLSATTVRCDFLVAFEFASGTKRAWNGNTELTIGGAVYQPMFGTGQIEGLGYTNEGTASDSVTLTLSGLPGDRIDILSAALADSGEVAQRMVTIALQLFDNNWQPVGAPINLFRGFMQRPKVSRTAMQDGEGSTQSISLVAENIFYGRARPANGRNTDRDQQSRSPGDRFFGFVAALVQKVITYPDY